MTFAYYRFEENTPGIPGRTRERRDGRLRGWGGTMRRRTDVRPGGPEENQRVVWFQKRWNSVKVNQKEKGPLEKRVRSIPT